MEVTGTVNLAEKFPPPCLPRLNRTPTSRTPAPGSPTPTWLRCSCATPR
ncbi:hypothetical protein I552_8505 [Mycobacterium xenopi 3993]|nr:hypothetical protein I552_8505 [Mycobacterium xenopi 3993]